MTFLQVSVLFCKFMSKHCVYHAFFDVLSRKRKAERLTEQIPGTETLMMEMGMHPGVRSQRQCLQGDAGNRT